MKTLKRVLKAFLVASAEILDFFAECLDFLADMLDDGEEDAETR